MCVVVVSGAAADGQGRWVWRWIGCETGRVVDPSRRRVLGLTGAVLAGLVATRPWRGPRLPGPQPPRGPLGGSAAAARPQPPTTRVPDVVVGPYPTGPTVPIPDPLPTAPPYNTVPDRTVTVPLTPIPVVPPPGWDEVVIGHSVKGVPMQLFVRNVGEIRHRVLVICGVHGNERGTGPIGERLLRVPIPDGVSACILPVANPDGWIAGKRHNARNVDLNRNFPWRWAEHDGGWAGAASEPETQALMGLVQGFDWSIVVWLHQPLGYVAPVPPTARVFGEAWGAAARLPYREELDQHGGGETWTAKVAGKPSMLVEVESHDATESVIDAHAAGFAALLALFA